MTDSIEALRSSIESLSKVLFQRQQTLDLQEAFENQCKSERDSANTQLDTLQTYLNNQTQQTVHCVSRLRNQQNFNHQLQAAIAQQRGLLEGKSQQYQLAKSQTLQTRLACKQIEKLIEQFQNKMSIMQNQYEQKVLDEMAGQLHRHHRML